MVFGFHERWDAGSIVRLGRGNCCRRTLRQVTRPAAFPRIVVRAWPADIRRSHVAVELFATVVGCDFFPRCSWSRRRDDLRRDEYKKFTFAEGVLSESKIHNRSGIPYLKDRKYIGKLFRFRQDTFRESELLVFITPQIIPPSAPRTPREEVAADYSREELDCNRRAPDVCWPCTNDDAWKRGGPRNLTHESTTTIHSAEPDNRATIPPLMESGEPTASMTRPPARWSMTNLSARRPLHQCRAATTQTSSLSAQS